MKPTREQILEASNEQLSEWVAEYVTHSVPCDKWKPFMPFSYSKDVDCGHERCHPEKKSPRYADDISAAWDVVRWANKNKISVEVVSHYYSKGGDCICTMWSNNDECEILGLDSVTFRADTETKAICVTALLAVLCT